MTAAASTAVAERKETRPAKPIDTVRMALERMKPQIQMALPKHLTVDRLLRVAITAVQNTPKLLECDRQSLYGAIMTCAQLGLEPDGVLGQAYLVPFAGRAQFIPGYKGLITLARNSGDVTSISAHEVCAKDKFVFAFGLTERCEHIPADGDRGEVTHFYAVARFKDGGHHFDVLTKAEVDVIRSRAPGKNSDAWKLHYVEMGKKTAIRRIAKYLPLNVQKAAALADSFEAGRHAELDPHGELVIDAEATEATNGNGNGHAKPQQSQLEKFEQATAGESEPVEAAQPEQPQAQSEAAPAPTSPLKLTGKARAEGWPAWTKWLIDEMAKMPKAQRPDVLKAHGPEWAFIAENRPGDVDAINAALDAPE